MSTAARILDVCDQVVAQIQTAWNPAAPSAVERVYAPDESLTAEDPNIQLQGRQVFVFPTKYEGPGMATRAELWRLHRVSILIVEQYTEAGAPPTAWVDARVGFVEQTIYNPLRNPALVLTGAIVTDVFPAPEEKAEVELYDLELLIQQKTFWSEVRLVFQELTDLTGS